MIVIQAIGIIAMVLNVLSYQGKNAKQIIFLQLISAMLFSIHFYLLGGITGALLNMVAVIRALFLFKFKKPNKYTSLIFFALIIAIYIINFTLLKKPPITANFLIEFLPTIAMCVQTIGMYSFDGNVIRYVSYFVSPCWLAYNVIIHSIGGAICESFALVSITVGLIRFRKNKKTNEKN